MEGKLEDSAGGATLKLCHVTFFFFNKEMGRVYHKKGRENLSSSEAEAGR